MVEICNICMEPLNWEESIRISYESDDIFCSGCQEQVDELEQKYVGKKDSCKCVEIVRKRVRGKT